MRFLELLGGEGRIDADAPESGLFLSSTTPRSVARRLELGDATLARGDYVDALAWLRRVATVGYELGPVYEGRREGWRLEVDVGRARFSQWFG